MRSRRSGRVYPGCSERTKYYTSVFLFLRFPTADPGSCIPWEFEMGPNKAREDAGREIGLVGKGNSSDAKLLPDITRQGKNGKVFVSEK